MGTKEPSHAEDVEIVSWPCRERFPMERRTRFVVAVLSWVVFIIGVNLLVALGVVWGCGIMVLGISVFALAAYDEVHSG